MSHELLDHKSKCRLCFKRISVIRSNCRITDKVREKFFRLTNIELKSSGKFLNYTCKPCFQTLNETSEFQHKMIDNQQRLYAFEGDNEKPVVKEEPTESCTIHLDQIDIEDFLPKTEVFDDTWVEDQPPEAPKSEEVSRSASPDDFNFAQDEDEVSPLAERDDAEQLPSEAFRIRSYIYHKYSLENLEKALHAICSGELTPHGAEKRFKVPSSTLRHIMKRDVHILTDAEELEVKHFVKRRVELKISTSDQDITTYALRILQQRKGSNRIKIKNLASHWITCFRIRHSDMVTETTLPSELRAATDTESHLLTEAEEVKVKLFVKRRVESEISTSNKDITAYVLRILQQRNASNRIEIKNLPCRWITSFRKRNSDMVTELRSDVEFSCDICGFSVKGKRNIKDHVHLHAKAGKKTISKPRKEYTKEALEEAVRAVTEGRLTKTKASEKYKIPLSTIRYKIEKTAEVDESQIQKCSFCEKVYFSHRMKRSHERLEHLAPVGEFPCTKCDKVYKKRSRLYTHNYLYHTRRNGPFKCKDCDQVFEKQSNLVAHRTTTHRERIACTVCGKLVTEGMKMASHMRSHAPSDTYKCTFEGCSKSYSKEKSLAYHIENTHSEKQNVKCSLCEKSFPNQGRLRFHIYRSHGEPRFFCEVDGCNYKNTRRAYLRLHLLNHKDIDTRTKGELIANIRNHRTNK